MMKKTKLIGTASSIIFGGLVMGSMARGVMDVASAQSVTYESGENMTQVLADVLNQLEVSEVIVEKGKSSKAKVDTIQQAYFVQGEVALKISCVKHGSDQPTRAPVQVAACTVQQVDSDSIAKSDVQFPLFELFTAAKTDIFANFPPDTCHTRACL